MVYWSRKVGKLCVLLDQNIINNWEHCLARFLRSDEIKRDEIKTVKTDRRAWQGDLWEQSFNVRRLETQDCRDMLRLLRISGSRFVSWDFQQTIGPNRIRPNGWQCEKSNHLAWPRKTGAIEKVLLNNQNAGCGGANKRDGSGGVCSLSQVSFVVLSTMTTTATSTPGSSLTASPPGPSSSSATAPEGIWQCHCSPELEADKVFRMYTVYRIQFR